MDMGRNRWVFSRMAPFGALLIILSCTSPMLAQFEPRAGQPQRLRATENGLVVGAAANDEQLAATRENLFELLQMSPKLTGAVANDPSLLGDQEYVNRSNPELAKFLQNHQEVVRNPEFYLFGNFGGLGRSSKRLHLERGVVSLDADSPQR